MFRFCWALGKALRPSARARACWVQSLAKKRRRRLLLDVQSRSVDKLPDIIAQGKRDGCPSALAGREPFGVEGPLSSGARKPQTIFSGLVGPRPGVERVAHMSKGHVDEIEQCSVRASFPEASYLAQFFGDLDQTIDFRHRAVLPLISAGAAPICFPVGPIFLRTPIKPL
jgi:hypothetical protein